MLYIKTNQYNLLYTSVSPHRTITNPTYLLSMEHAQSGKKYQVIPENVTSLSGSPYNARYDIFKVGVFESGVNPTGGTINIDEVGQFYYSIREQVSTTNLNPSLSGEKLEEGLLYLTQDFTDTYYYSGGTVNVYDPTETPTYHILQEDEYHILTEDNNLLRQE